jgi:hypothetical protein
MSRLEWIARVDWFKVAKVASLVAALALVAQSEWMLALAVGWPPYIAWAAPLALDAYVLAAIRSGSDLGASVVVSAASVLGSHAVYASGAAWDGGTAGTGHLVWQLAAACSVVPLLVTWRVHHLRLPAPVEEPQAPTEASVQVTLEEPAPAPVPVATPAAPAPVKPAAAHRVRTATDTELAEVIAAELQTNRKAGRNTVTAALKERGLTPGKTERLTDALAAQKRQGLHAVTG